ncbi:MAG: membrane protein insertase YidC, partial [Planktomarina sp.]
MDDQNKNLLLAVALSFAVMLAWFAISPPTTAPEETATDTTATTPVAEATGNTDVSTAPTTGNAAAVAAAGRITIDTPRLSGSLSLLAGRIDDLQLKDYNVTMEDGSPIVTLLSPEGSENAYYELNGWAAASGVDPSDVPGPTTLWTADKTTLSPGNPVTLTWDNGKGLTFSRRIDIDNDYMFDIQQSVTNTGATTASMAPYSVIARHGEPQDLKGFYILHEGMVRMADGIYDYAKYKHLPDYDIDPKERGPADVIQVAEKGWIGFTDHYWMTTLIPSNPHKVVGKYDPNRDVYEALAVDKVQVIVAG